jgi:Fe-S-cluster containining protein
MIGKINPDAAETGLALLCQSCGLCCDGSLFGRVDLESEEVERARKLRLKVVPSGKTFEQPCSALVTSGSDDRARRSCSIYDERPLSCRRFACRLYERHRREGGPIEPRLLVVRRVRLLLENLEASGLRPEDLATDAYAELAQRLEEDFARAGEAAP